MRNQINKDFKGFFRFFLYNKITFSWIQLIHDLSFQHVFCNRLYLYSCPINEGCTHTCQYLQIFHILLSNIFFHIACHQCSKSFIFHHDGNPHKGFCMNDLDSFCNTGIFHMYSFFLQNAFYANVFSLL